VADLATPTYRVGSSIARAIPAPLAEVTARTLGRAYAQLPTGKRRNVRRLHQRVRPGLHGRALRRAVSATFESYARYWMESFRLPDMTPEQVDAGFSHEGFELVETALDAGRGCILATPHLGSWEWAGFWLARVQQVDISVVVERREPPALFEWFAELRRGFGFEVIPLGPDAATASVRALAANRALCLVSDRDLAGGGVEVDFFGERTTLPAGPALLALRSGAPLLPVAVYHRHGRNHGVVRPPLDTSRQGKLRADTARVTQDLAHALEDLIRAAPEQWHLTQPNWPSDRGAT
jgi:phosphatidylinositol dimannoside acyltransferase